MELNELKLISASNIINLRTKAGMTQAELGAKLNYSDKTVSKWERGEAIPDAFVLKQMAELFGVSVDHLLSSNDSWNAPPIKEPAPQVTYSVPRIIAVCVLGVLTLGLTAFVTLWLLGIVEWRIFVGAAAAAVLVHMVLDCVFYKAKNLKILLSMFIVAVLSTLYVFLPHSNPWQLFLIAAPSIAIGCISCDLKRGKGLRIPVPGKRKKR